MGHYHQINENEISFWAKFNPDAALGFVMKVQNAIRSSISGYFGTEAWSTLTVGTKMFRNA